MLSNVVLIFLILILLGIEISLRNINKKFNDLLEIQKELLNVIKKKKED